MKEKNVALPGAEILASLITAVLILTLTPLTLGFVDATGAAASLIWTIPGFILLIVAIVRLFQEGNVLMATVNAILTGMALCQSIGRGVIVLLFILTGAEMPASLAQNLDIMSGGGFLVSGIFLSVMVMINWKGGKRFDACCILLPTIGFIFQGLGSFGMTVLTLPGFVLLDIFGLYMLYQAISGVFHFVMATAKPE